MSIEDIILAQDKRGISALRSHLPSDYCLQTARFVLDHPGPVLIATGFSIPMAQATETDQAASTDTVATDTPSSDTAEADAPSAEEQTEQVLHNLRTVLEGLGLTLHDVAKTTVFLKNMDDFEGMNKVYGRLFGEHRPARTTIAIQKNPLDALVEIECIAEAAG